MFYLLGDLFQLLFTPYKIPYLGFIINWGLVFTGTFLLLFWIKKLIALGDEKDENYTGI